MYRLLFPMLCAFHCCGFGIARAQLENASPPAVALLEQPTSNPAEELHAAVDESFFPQTLYPEMLRMGCQDCHNDNGVASDTLLEFPNEHANRERVLAFGLELLEVVDRADPDQSLLLLKPTDREDHTGGERITPGSREEQLLVQWIDYLAGLSEEETRQATARIERAKMGNLNQLTTRRLTHSQYNHTVRDLLKDQTQPGNQFPKEDFIHGFQNQSEGQGISPLQAEAYSKAAERLAVAAFRGGDHLGLLSGQPRSLDDRQVAEGFVRDFGLRAFRRPLTETELAAYATLFLEDARRMNDFLSGGRIVIETMLQSPHFLFRVERGSGNNLEQFERASRLSYFLWDTMPSDELLLAASRGELATMEQVSRWARQMLKDPRAQKSMEEFLSQWLRFDRVLTANRDSRRFEAFNSEVAAAMVEETTRLFNHLVWEDRNFLEFYTADYTFLNRDLAEIYDMPAPPSDFARVAYPSESGRAGIFGHGTFLVATSKPAETSPTERGLFVRSQFLSHEVPAPPAGVTTTLPEITEESPMTNRQRLAIHLNSEACSGCHRLIDPIGLGLEQYDPIGAYNERMVIRTGGRTDSKTIELELDTRAYIQGIGDSQFSNPRELGQVLAGSEAGQRAVVKQLFRYAFGRQETTDDKADIDAMLRQFHDSGFKFQELIIALVTSRLFLQES